MSEKNNIQNLISPIINGLGYQLIRIEIFNKGQKTLQIMVERLDRKKITLEDCSLISQEISATLDVDCPINQAYLLEVSSPGIDRPLLDLHDYAKYAGFNARVDMNSFYNGRKSFNGKLLGIQDVNIKIRANEQTYLLPFCDVQRAKLLLTEELLNSVVQT